MRQNGSDPPVFKTDEDRSYLCVSLPIHPLFLETEVVTPNEGDKKRIPRKTREEIKTLILEKLNEKGELSMGELAKELGYKKLTDSVRAAVEELFTADVAEYLYPDAKNSRAQKIRLK